MTSDIQSNIDKLKQHIVYLGTVVEESLHTSIKAAQNLDSTLAAAVQDADDKINALEVNIEQACTKILALHQPVASDLRFVVAVLKINSELERIGDLASKVGDKILLISAKRRKTNPLPKVIIPENFATIFSQTKDMFSQCLDAFVNEDADLAYRILIADDAVDESKQRIREELKEIGKTTPNQLAYSQFLLSIARILERIADHTTHIAEDTIYMLQGRIIRHTEDIF